MRVIVKLFGPQAKAAAARSVTAELPDDEATCARLRTALASACPALGGSLDVSRFAVNHEFADDDRLIASGDEIALIGPVSGG